MRINWHRQHRWSGIVACLFMLVFCVSGIILNHRTLSERVNIPRVLLPPFYAFGNWNLGLLRGTFCAGSDSVVIYGDGGIFLADSAGVSISDFSAGLPPQASERNVRAVVRRDGRLYALTTAALYRYDDRWTPLLRTADRLSDMTVRGDTLAVVGRSMLYLSVGGGDFHPVQLSAPENADIATNTAFRTVWKIHTGELLGLPGRLVVDALAAEGVLLSVTGLVVFILPRCKRRRLKLLRNNVTVHRKAGAWTFFLLLFVCLTGWMLRPPLMVPLVKWHVAENRPADGNPWADKLRMLRYDGEVGQWLLSTSHGFFAMDSLSAVPVSLASAPPVSVMGLNVWEREGSDWVCGSFTGFYRWNRATGAVTDIFTGEEVSQQAGASVGAYRVAGYSADFGTPFAVLYDRGTDRLRQPERLSRLPMSLWNAALEAHTGRIYFGAVATWFFIFLAGAIVLWCLWSGWKLRH